MLLPPSLGLCFVERWTLDPGDEFCQRSWRPRARTLPSGSRTVISIKHRESNMWWIYSTSMRFLLHVYHTLHCKYYFNWMKGLQIHQIIGIDQGGTWLQRKFSWSQICDPKLVPEFWLRNWYLFVSILMDYCFHVRLREQERSPKTTCNSKFLIGIFSLAFLIGKSFRSRPFNLQDSRKMSIDQMRRIFFRELRSKGRREGITLRSTLLLLPFLSFNRTFVSFGS